MTFAKQNKDLPNEWGVHVRLMIVRQGKSISLISFKYETALYNCMVS